MASRQVQEEDMKDAVCIQIWACISVSAISINGAVDEEFAHLVEMSQNKLKFEQAAFEINMVI